MRYSGKSGADGCFLELSTKARVNRAVIALQTLDDTIYQSPEAEVLHGNSCV